MCTVSQPLKPILHPPRSIGSLDTGRQRIQADRSHRARQAVSKTGARLIRTSSSFSAWGTTRTWMPLTAIPPLALLKARRGVRCLVHCPTCYLLAQRVPMPHGRWFTNSYRPRTMTHQRAPADPREQQPVGPRTGVHRFRSSAQCGERRWTNCRSMRSGCGTRCDLSRVCRVRSLHVYVRLFTLRYVAPLS